MRVNRRRRPSGQPTKPEAKRPEPPEAKCPNGSQPERKNDSIFALEHASCRHRSTRDFPCSALEIFSVILHFEDKRALNDDIVMSSRILDMCRDEIDS